LGIIFALLLVVVAVVIIWLGPIAEWYLERNDKDIVGSTSRRSRYTVSIVIDGEEMAVNSPEDEDDEVEDNGEIVVEDNNMAKDTL
jgi:hypothetical protein